ncbi:MAG: DUF1287 domain-containing protein, partial [Syntrophomonadaceae bacterium]|nr:DUF1287 domain-containing protein [Syntrophomonadaceae bacterium]
MKHLNSKIFLVFIVLALLSIFYGRTVTDLITSSGSQVLDKGSSSNSSSSNSPSPVELIPSDKLTTPDFILLGARKEVHNRVVYDASYQAIEYPLGDVPADRGACTDVVVRAFRNAGIDLQQLIHEDMAKNFKSYPQDWGLSQPDPNIDHRRVPNQVTFFKRHGLELNTDASELDEWKWGDVVYWKFSNGLDHCGIISDRKTKDGRPLVIHNAGRA